MFLLGYKVHRPGQHRNSPGALRGLSEGCLWLDFAADRQSLYRLGPGVLGVTWGGFLTMNTS